MNDNILKLDGIDKEIVRMLMTNSRRPILELTSERNFLLAVDESGKLSKLSLN